MTWRAKLPFLRRLTYLHQPRFMFYVKTLYTTDYLQNISCIWKPQVISGGHWTLLLDPPLLRPRRKHWQSFERARVSVCTCRTLNPNFTWSLAMHWRQYTQADQSRAHESSDGSGGYNLNRFNVKYLPGYQNTVILYHATLTSRRRILKRSLHIALLLKTCSWAFVCSCYNIILSYLVESSMNHVSCDRWIANKWYLIRMCISRLVL